MLYSVFNEHLLFYELELSLWASREAISRNQKVMLFDCIGRSGWTRTIDLALIRRAL